MSKGKDGGGEAGSVILGSVMDDWCGGWAPLRWVAFRWMQCFRRGEGVG